MSTKKVDYSRLTREEELLLEAVRIPEYRAKIYSLLFPTETNAIEAGGGLKNEYK